jgi:hypothetical protein
MSTRRVVASASERRRVGEGGSSPRLKLLLWKRPSIENTFYREHIL